MAYLAAIPGGVRLHVHAQPGAKRSEIVGPHGDALKIKIKAVPEDGKANAALLKFLAKAWDLPRGSLSLLSGAASRRKTVLIAGDAAVLLPRLRDWLKDIAERK